jgi:signal transduction histidine kinase/ActR/RegA family two-component response regulator
VTPLAPSDLRRSLRRTRLAVRLAVLSAALAGFVVCGVFIALSVQVRASTRQLFSDELSRSQRTLAELQRENRRRLVLTAALLADSPNLRSAIATYRVERQSNRVVRSDLSATVQRELDRLGRDLNAGAVLATDEEGRVFAGYVRSGVPLPPGFDLSRLPAVKHALDPAFVTDRGEPYLAGLELGDGYFAVGVAPLILDGYTIGTLVFGQQVDSTLVRTLRNAFDGQVVASAGTHVIAATIPGAERATRVLDSAATGRAIGIDDQEYLAAVLPMGRTQRGNELRLTLLQPLTPAVRTLTARLRRDFVLYGALAVLLAALGAAMLSRSLLRPLRAFIATIRSGASDGRIDQPFDASEASQEIRVLNESFTQLMGALDRERSQLERRGTELAAANAVLTDEIAQRERAEQALRESEAQLRQSQKLESIGTLAGGIAHDFNNLLTVISGFTQLAMGRLGKTHDVTQDLKEVKEAAERASGLTRQLLAFSRKQVLQPRVLDLTETVAEMQDMLRRLIGSHIGLRVMHDGRPTRMKADPSQLEQVLMNLVVNARDAMPDGGAITVTTSCELDPAAGWRVVLRVQDTGTGMSPAVRERIFEPFYTTKEPGKGTGLGLATVYGVVTQSGGTISVDSAVGRGTTFTVSFPPATEITLPKVEEDDTGPAVRGTETVLIAEDDDAIRSLSEQALRSCGFKVTSAPGGVEALTLARTMSRLDVLLTDVMMPQLGGQQLAERLTATNPGLCVIYMTGWVDESISQLELSTDVALVRKPFTARSLARAVRSALDQRAAPPILPRGVLR